jgi:glutamyl-tRNA reductase
VDISVPRNIDPACAEIDNLFVFDVDDLEAVIASNVREREAARHAHRRVGGEGFRRGLARARHGPRTGAFRQELQDIARCEFAKSRNRLGLTPEQERAVEAMLVAAANKIAHPAIQVMRRAHEALPAAA